MTAPPVDRRAARVLLVDAEDRVLLQQCCDPADRDRTWWVTTGGGIDEGETPAQAAAREVREETGLHVASDDLGDVVHERQSEFRFGGVDYRQSEHYYLLRTTAFDAAPTGHSDLEMQMVLGMRWWSREELRSTAERVYPEELGEVLDRVLR